VARDTTRKISFKPTSRRSPHLRTDQDWPCPRRTLTETGRVPSGICPGAPGLAPTGRFPPAPLRFRARPRQAIRPSASYWRCFSGRRYPRFMTMTPEHVDLHRMVDRLDPDQGRALRAAAQQLLPPSAGHPASGETQAPEPGSLLAAEPVRDFSFIGLFNGAPDLAERSEDILREEFAKRAHADR